jgi:hypothetical protein
MVAACKSGASDTAGTAATAKYDNTGTAPITVMVQVVTTDAAEAGTTFTIDAAIAAIPPPAANDACGTPAVLVANTLTNGTTTSATSNMGFFGTGASATCSGSGTAKRDVYYSLDIPAGKMVTITVMPSGMTMDTLINVIEPVTMCAGVTACIADDDTGFGGEADIATYTNTGTAAKTVLIQVATWSNFEGDFTIRADIP